MTERERGESRGLGRMRLQWKYACVRQLLLFLDKTPVQMSGEM